MKFKKIFQSEIFYRASLLCVGFPASYGRWTCLSVNMTSVSVSVINKVISQSVSHLSTVDWTRLSLPILFRVLAVKTSVLFATGDEYWTLEANNARLFATFYCAYSELRPESNKKASDDLSDCRGRDLCQNSVHSISNCLHHLVSSLARFSGTVMFGNFGNIRTATTPRLFEC